MDSEHAFDAGLYGVWPVEPVYVGLEGAREAMLADLAAHALLDTKAQPDGSPLDELQSMLNAMTRELRQQMQQFALLREQAESRAAGSLDEIDRKLVQADAKASIEAMSVIVRTLEKIDSLQRTIAHDRQMQAEQDFDEVGYQAFVAGLEAKVEIRARALAGERLREAGAGIGTLGGAGDDGAASAGTGAGPP